jgi:hypothetical protein
MTKRKSGCFIIRLYIYRKMTGGGYVTVKRNTLETIQNGGKKDELIDVIEKKLQRFDNLIIKHKNGQALTEKEQEDLLKLTPQVSSAIVTISKVARRLIKTKTGFQKGGNGDENKSETDPDVIGTFVSAVANVTKEEQEQQGKPEADAPPANAPENQNQGKTPDQDPNQNQGQGQEKNPDKEKLMQYLNELEKKQQQLIEEGERGIQTASEDAQQLNDLINEIKAALMNENNEPVKYPDLGNAVLNTVSNAIKKIKDWFNKLLGNTNKGAADRLKSILKLPEGKEEGEHTLKAVDETTSKIDKTINKHFKTIANSGVETILNAFSLVPGIGTTLQLWRLVHSVINMITGTIDKTNELKNEVIEGAEKIPNAIKEDAKAGAGAAATTDAAGAVTPGTPDATGTGPENTGTSGTGPVTPNTAIVGGGGRNKHSRRNNIQDVKHFTRRLKSVEEYRREYNKAKREINKTKHRIIKSLRNYINI